MQTVSKNTNKQNFGVENYRPTVTDIRILGERQGWQRTSGQNLSGLFLKGSFLLSRRKILIGKFIEHVAG